MTYFDDLRNHFEKHKPSFYPAFPNRKNNIAAGVLVALYDDQDLTCLMTQRSSALKDHSGEMCFPGGKRQPEDTSLQETALREAREEINLRATVIGKLSSIPLYTSDFRLEPYVALAQTPLQDLRSNTEVEHIVPISIRHIFEQPFLEGTPFTYQGQSLVSPHFRPSHLLQNPFFTQITYGGTAIVLYELLQQIAIITDQKLPLIKSVDWPKDLSS